MLKNLQLPYVLSQGYVNLRCVWALGCPSEMRLDQPPTDSSLTTEAAYPQAFQELFPGRALPLVVGVGCCAQFAVSGARIRDTSLSQYEHYRRWLLETSLEDHISGRVLEYSWHMIFGKEPVHCLNAEECYCNVFGFCKLECQGNDKCGERWPFPPSATLPDGWPKIGWEGESRDKALLDKIRSVEIIPSARL